MGGDFVNSSSDYFRIYLSLQVKPRFIRKEYQLRIDLTFDDRLQKTSAKMNPLSWIVRLQDVDYCCFIYIYYLTANGF
jgi:hypothetical protein